MYVREEGNEELFLLVAFDLPFDEITNVHYCQEEGNKCVRDNKIKDNAAG